MQSLADTINKILTSFGIEQICREDIRMTDKIITDIGTSNNKLSNLIADKLWPFFKEATVYHYTTKASAEAILNSQTFRLYNIGKRIHQDEIGTFCRDHNLTGYLQRDENNYKTLLVANIFYASFAQTYIDEDCEQKMWNQFASPDGVRLKIKITSKFSNMRKMAYQDNKPFSLLADLTAIIKSKYNKQFILTGISRLCAYYLPNKYSCEYEIRTLFKKERSSDTENTQPLEKLLRLNAIEATKSIEVKNDGEWDYIEIPLEIDEHPTGYRFEILEILTDESLNLKKDNYQQLVKDRN